MIGATETATPRRFGMTPTVILMILCGSVVSISFGLRQSLGLFQPPMTAQIAVSASAFGFAMALQSIVWGASQPVIGMLADRFGALPVIAGTSAIYALGLALMASVDGPVGLDLGGGVMAGLGVAGTGLGILLGVIARAVPDAKRSQAVGTVAALGSLGTFLLAPIGQWMIDTLGWRGALMGFAGIAGTMMLLALPIGRGRSDAATKAASAADGRSLGEVLRAAGTHRGYLAMTAAFFACGFQLVFITTHLPAYLAFCNVNPGVSATALALIGLCNTIGTYVMGQLGARYSQKRLLALVYLFRTLFIIAYISLPVSATSTLIFASALGFLWLGVAPLVSGLVGRLFGLKYFGTLYGIVFFSHQVGSFFGALMGGLIFDLTGAYGFAWAAMIAIGLIAFALQWPMDDRPPVARGLAEPRPA